MLPVTQIANDYLELEDQNMSKSDIFFSLYEKYGSSLTTLMFSLEYQVEEYGLRWDWDSIYERNDVYNYLDKKIKDKQHKAIILSRSPDFELNWITDKYNDLDWDYVELSETFVRLDLPFSYIEDNDNKDWCFNILSHHPSLTKEIVCKYPRKEWCIVTIFDKFEFENDKTIKINKFNKSYIEDVPSICPLWYIIYSRNYFSAVRENSIATYTIFLPGKEEPISSDTICSDIEYEIFLL